VDAEPVTRVEIVEVGPRDGLQNESRLLPTQTKLELIGRAYAAGLRRIEVTSFVHPARVPQMADAEAVVAGLPLDPGLEVSALVLNERGYDRALAAGIRSVNTFVATTDGFSARNQGMTVEETLAVVAALRSRAADDGIALTVTVGTAFGCPFEGEVSAGTLAAVLTRVAALAPSEIALADTIGVAVPSDVEERLALAAAIAPTTTLRLHFHNTRSTGIANAIAAVRAGAHVLDASLAGIGGCPFAPAATGNIATEDIVYALERMGYDTGVSLEQAAETARWIAGELGIEPPGMVARAGGFP
jgi:hydroxymethylglutaryl-CoA lyase